MSTDYLLTFIVRYSSTGENETDNSISDESEEEAERDGDGVRDGTRDGARDGTRDGAPADDEDAGGSGDRDNELRF